jgi:asparagine synthetase B (glutamine-hydrolysing)
VLRDELTAAGIAFGTRSDTEVLLAAEKWGTECLAPAR